MTSAPVAAIHQQAERKRPLAGRLRWDRGFLIVGMVAAAAAVVILAILMLSILGQGVPRLSWHFLTAPPSYLDAGQAGVRPSLLGTIWVGFVCAAFTLPLGVATAIFLEEFPPRHWLLRRFHSFVQLNVNNLAGVPSIVYGMIGLTAFANMFGLLGNPLEPALEIGRSYFDQFVTEGKQFVVDGQRVVRGRAILKVPVAGHSAPRTKVEPGLTALTSTGRRVRVNVVPSRSHLPDDVKLLRRTLVGGQTPGRVSIERWYYIRLPFGRGVLTGALTLMLVVLPVVIIASQEALRAVPDSLREGSLGMGATPWQTVWNITLPAATPGILTGSILAMSRAVGEAAPILMISGIVYIASSPGNLMDDFAIMPLVIYGWIQESREEFHSVAAAGIIVLLVVLLSFNGLAVWLRQKMQKPLS